MPHEDELPKAGFQGATTCIWVLPPCLVAGSVYTQSSSQKLHVLLVHIRIKHVLELSLNKVYPIASLRVKKRVCIHLTVKMHL